MCVFVIKNNVEFSQKDSRLGIISKFQIVFDKLILKSKK